MGNSASSTSKVTQKYDTTIVNKSDINILNKNVNDFVSNTVVDQAANCSAAINQLQTVKFNNIKTEGDFNIGDVNQNQKSAITFDCVQTSSFKNDIADGISTKYTNALKNSYSTEAEDKLSATAGSAANMQFAGTGNSKAKSISNTDYKFTNITETNKNIQNIIENSIQNNLSMSDVQECIAQTIQNQEISFQNLDIGGSVNIKALNQDQAADMMTSCVQSKDNASKITKQIATDLGITVDETSSVKKTTEITSAATSEAKNTGVFESIGNMVSSITSGNTLISLILCIICICMLACCFIYFRMRGSSMGASMGASMGSSMLSNSIKDIVSNIGSTSLHSTS